MVSRFTGRDIIAKPACPFCGALIERPAERKEMAPTEMPVGACACGAVYACDVTGHNLGSAMIEALVFGCHGDWDLAWSLLPETDYLEEQVKGYDLEGHLIVHGGVYEGRRISGTLYFVKLHKEVRSAAEEETETPSTRPAPAVSPSPIAERKGKKSFSKKDVEALVKGYELAPLLRMAEQDTRIIRDLQRLLYSVDKHLRWKAADILGKASGVIALHDPAAITKLLQRLFSSVADTAASSWGSIDAIGEIISQRSEQFAGYVPQLYRFAADRALLPEVLRALGKIVEKRPDLLRDKAHRFIPLLQDPDPEIRGYSVLLLADLGAPEAREALARLVHDPADLEVYGEGITQRRTIGRLASEALKKA